MRRICLLLFLPLLLAACDEPDRCKAGAKNCGCYATSPQSCQEGLTCISNTCRGPDYLIDGGTEMPPPTCTQECDDGIGCTVDSCVNGMCSHVPENGRCNSGESCDLIEGKCVMGTACASDADCLADMKSCRVEKTCSPSIATCLWQMLDKDEDGVPPRVCGGMDPDDNDPTVVGPSGSDSNPGGQDAGS